MPAAATLIAGEVEMRFDAAARKSVESAFGAHKLFPMCQRVIEWTGDNKKDVLFLDGKGSANAPMGAARVPGYLQWKVTVPPDADSITVSATLQQQSGLFGGGDAAALELVVGPAGQPVTWTAGADKGNEVMSAPFSGATGMVTATLKGLTAGPQYVMIVNGGGSIIGRNISFATDCSLGPGNCVPPDMAMGGGSGGGCSCDVGGRGPLGGVYVLFGAFFALALLTRAARRRSR
jgi:MYXO-CTERM domain-containing protein